MVLLGFFFGRYLTMEFPKWDRRRLLHRAFVRSNFARLVPEKRWFLWLLGLFGISVCLRNHHPRRKPEAFQTNMFSQVPCSRKSKTLRKNTCRNILEIRLGDSWKSWNWDQSLSKNMKWKYWKFNRRNPSSPTLVQWHILGIELVSSTEIRFLRNSVITCHYQFGVQNPFQPLPPNGNETAVVALFRSVVLL